MNMFLHHQNNAMDDESCATIFHGQQVKMMVSKGIVITLYGHSKRMCIIYSLLKL